MTVLVGVRCTDGIVIGADSIATSTAGQQGIVRLPTDKLTIIGDRVILAGTGAVGLGQRFQAIVQGHWDQQAFDKPALDCLLSLAANGVNNFRQTGTPFSQPYGFGYGAMEEAKVRVGDTKALCDIITASRLDGEVRYQFETWEKDRASIGSHPARHRALKVLRGLKVFHFPVAFPEVFLRRRSGFDVIVGNPPWEKVKIEEHAFWGRNFPGLRSLPQREFELERTRLRRERPDLVTMLETEVEQNEAMRKALTSGAYPGMGTGDPDLYKAFMWRFWSLVAADGGRIGVVLPRSAFAAKGSEAFRKVVFAEAASVDLTMLLNNRKWVFDEVHPQYTIGLVAIERGQRNGKSIALRGPYANLLAFNAGCRGESARFTAEDVFSWDESAALPLLPTESSLGIFLQLRKSPRLDLDNGVNWRARPDTELHATAQKPLMDFSTNPPAGYWPVMKGESFDLWSPDRGSEYYYAWADPIAVTDWLYAKRLRASRGGAQAEFNNAYRSDRNTLACYRPRIAFRDMTRATDSRTVRLALVPPEVFLVHLSPYILFSLGDQRDEAFLLAVLSSLPLDWYARRWIETHLTYAFLNPLPIPRPSRADPLWKRTVALAGRLAAPDDRFADWAATVGVEHGPMPADMRQDMLDELDALVARLYGLSENQLTHLFETFHEGWDFAPRLAAVMEHFRRLTEAEPV